LHRIAGPFSDRGAEITGAGRREDG
jgi:hypothetical protein